ncbi:PREDICTED: putative UPF0481 protein At3g02645 [Ipomoea nil]|uniref:putative UPF0481 protein At3g02645 n=1 Tax=Ipomoea nil TaxID=35883 RepID=UPI000901F370|nr:PREDICTED: putative UPF0481 protein At3g02645 [Ipomoea nil]XP_019170757.1 PREDICTED: putative UPF0481 protein At3g02645 [Ipomoea nil]XP_019170758.1 PREDICTED: putative UPF0481 protein At3g02645 [Ipomoea nil]
MEEEYDMSEDTAVSETLENENIQESLQIRANFCPPNTGNHQYNCIIDMNTPEGAEGGGDGNGEIEMEVRLGLGGENDRGEANNSHLPLPYYKIVGDSGEMKYMCSVPKYRRVIEERTYTPSTSVSNGSYPTFSIGLDDPYTPQTVSIGPCHHENPKLSDMESQKRLLFDSMECHPDPRPSLTAAMMESEVEARNSYSTKFKNIDTDTFCKMMLIDAFFIIHTFIYFDRWYKNPNDPELQRQPIFKTPWRQPNICEDLLMLENQLPFFILVKVYHILTNESADCLKKLALQFFKQVEFGRADGGNSETVADDDPKHLLDLFHSSFVVVDKSKKMQKGKKNDTLLVDEKPEKNNTPVDESKLRKRKKNDTLLVDEKPEKNNTPVDKSKLQKRKKNNTPVDESKMENINASSLSLRIKMTTSKCWVSSASELSSRGVTLIATNKGNPLDIQFNHYIGHLRVPTLYINDRTVTVLKNLLAYEQGSHLLNPYFTCLAIFFFNIASSPDDVKLLREAGIINHQPADDGAIVFLLDQLNKASQNCFNVCLIQHHLQLIQTYLISVRARVISAVRLLTQILVSIIVTTVVNNHGYEIQKFKI